MIDQGATTLWETWSYPENFPSQNHPMFGSIDEWFYRSILGINPGTSSFEKIIIKPQPVEGLSSAKGEFTSLRGVIKSGWTLVQNAFTLQVSIPPNTRAELWIPTSPNGSIKESGQILSRVRYEKNYAVLEVSSGNYAFESSAPVLDK